MSRFARRIQAAKQNIVVPPSGNLLGWELTTSNTGLAQHGINGATLPTYTGSQTPAAGSVISQMKITQPLDLSNGNITLDRCLIQPTSVGQGLPVITTIGCKIKHQRFYRILLIVRLRVQHWRTIRFVARQLVSMALRTCRAVSFIHLGLDSRQLAVAYNHRL